MSIGTQVEPRFTKSSTKPTQTASTQSEVNSLRQQMLSIQVLLAELSIPICQSAQRKEKTWRDHSGSIRSHKQPWNAKARAYCPSQGQSLRIDHPPEELLHSQAEAIHPSIQRFTLVIQAGTHHSLKIMMGAPGKYQNSEDHLSDDQVTIDRTLSNSLYVPNM